jgi:hypothetical protein
MSDTGHPMHTSANSGHVARVWTIPPLAQYDATTCWEAAGHMAYLWKHRKERDPRQGYAKAAANYRKDYLPKDMTRLATFCGKLGMRWVKVANPQQVETMLVQSPLVIWHQRPNISHIMLLVGFSEHNWYYINPQVKNEGDSTQHTFGEHHYDAATKTHTANTIITPHGVKMRSKQASWHAARQHQPKDKLYGELRKVIFGYFDPAKANTGQPTHV